MSNYCVCCPRSNKDYPGSKTNESLDLYLLFFFNYFSTVQMAQITSASPLCYFLALIFSVYSGILIDICLVFFFQAL